MKKAKPSRAEAPPRILDCTLRDGSYAINFQFTAADTSLIVGELDRAGIGLIEVGHGIGFGASEAGLSRAVEADRDYVRAAAKAVRRAKIGAFCIPGIAKLDHLSMAKGEGLDFVRIGTDVFEARKARPFVEKARALGLGVMTNFMKSYAVGPREFAKQAKLSASYGSELVYIVDSAGGMTPSELPAYFEAVRAVSDVPLGFHGHDNLGLAVGNSIRSIELGAKVIDGSLQGMGRSAGNAPTEMLASLFDKMGYSDRIDPVEVMDVSEKYVRPLIRRRGISSLDVTCGHGQFHSSYMGAIRAASTKHGVDPRRLVLALTRKTKVSAPPELVDRLARGLRRRFKDVFTARFEFDEYHGAEQK